MLKLKERFKFNSWFNKKTLLFLLVLIVAIVILRYVYHNKQTRNTTANFLTTTVQRGTIENAIEGSGSLQPSERYTLKTKTAGTVQKILVKEGTQVKKGQPLLRLNNDEVVFQAKQTALEWEIAQTDLTTMCTPLPETNYNRRSLELKIEQYKIALEDKQAEKSKLILTTPFDGKILDSELQIGQRVNTGTTAMSLATTNEFEMVAQFSENDINNLVVGMKTDSFFSSSGKTYTGKVKKIAFVSTTTDQKTNTTSSGTYEVILTLDKPDESLRPGMTAWNTIYIVKDKELPDYIFMQGKGYLRYAQSEEIVTEVTGTVAEIYHKPGDKVLKNEPLLRLSNNEIDRQIKEAENQLANAEEDLRQLLSPDEETRKQQELKVEQNLQKMSVSTDQLNSLNVTAPIDGVVVSLSVATGDELSAGQEIMVISNFTKNTLEISIDELDINKIKFGQEALVSIDALPSASLTGRVIGIAQEGTTSDGVTKYPVTLEVDYTEGIKAGMTASATIKLEKKGNVLRIPAEALITNNNRTMVRVVENGQPQMQPIKTGLNNGRWVEVLEGLKEGQQIVLAATSSTEQNQVNMTRMRMPGGGGMPAGSGGMTGGTRNPGGSNNSGNFRQRTNNSN